MILASQSPRRIELMREAGYDIRVIPADIDETPFDDEAPLTLVERLARAKAAAGAAVPTISRGRVTFVDAALPQGVVVPDANLAVFSIADLNARMDANRARSRRKVDITQITFPFKPGDYVVHATHGIALFSEIARQEVGGKERDYFLLEYADGDKLYVPLEQVDRITRYVGPDGDKPRLTRLNTADWTRATNKARKNAKKLAFDLDDIHAASQNHKTMFYRQGKAWNYLISANRFSTDVFERAFCVPREKIIEVGYPRNDILYSERADEIAKEVKKEFGIPEDKRVILYAPTWRDNQFYGKGKYKFTLAMDLERMRKEFGKDSVILLRTHYYIADSLDLTGLEDFVYNGSTYNDVSRLYLASDICITDYSSVFFDYANLRRPMLFFAYDYEDYYRRSYRSERLPGSIYSCRNQISGKNRYGNGLQRETMCGSRNFYY